MDYFPRTLSDQIVGSFEVDRRMRKRRPYIPRVVLRYITYLVLNHVYLSTRYSLAGVN